jgi:hypothetical protein
MDSSLFQQLLLWLVAVGVIALARARRKESGVGLVLAYLLNLWLIHWLAVALYLLPNFRNNDPQIVSLGFEQSLYAVMAFAFGSVVLAPFVTGSRKHSSASSHVLDRRLPKAYVVFGAISFMALSIGLGGLPSATAVLSTGQQLVVAGLGLCCWQAWKERNYKMLQFWLAMALLMPFITIVTRGFIGYGAAAAFSVIVFISSFVRSRVLILAGGIVLGYLGLSVFVTYMRDRGEIRDVVWGGQSLHDRIDRVATSISNFEWFDPSNDEHLKRVDNRLNQSYLVGLGVSRLSDVGGYGHGATLWEALLALIPRALWPDKPVSAGSGNLVSEYTGVQYAAGTSVGIGQVMEFYVNFGTLGVVMGFVVMGLLVTTLDTMAASSLARNDLHGFIIWYLPGLSLLQVGGSMVEVTSSAVASLIVAYAVNRYLDRMQRKQSVAASSPLVIPSLSQAHE